MNTELIGKVSQLEQRLDGLIKPEVARQLVSPFLDIPGKVGLWYAGDVQRSTGNIYDTSGQNRTLTYNGDPIFKQLDNGIAYVDLDGTGDYFSRSDETDLDILGTEAHNAGGSPGLTIGGWFRPDNTAAVYTLMSKWNTSQQSYLLDINTGGVARFIISSDGSDAFVVSSATVTILADVWYFIVGRYEPGTPKIDVFVDAKKDTNTTSIPAAIFNSSADFNIGSYLNGSARLFPGHFPIGFLSANALSDAYINRLFQHSRVFFGV